MKIVFPYSSQIASLERIEFKQGGAVRPMNEIAALGKTDASLRKDGFVYVHLEPRSEDAPVVR